MKEHLTYDEHLDIWAAGGVAHFIATGTHLFNFRTRKVMLNLLDYTNDSNKLKFQTSQRSPSYLSTYAVRTY
jgi:hypothetical protein